ncbi:hypothetical protein ES703_52911 [subsurface metagenome]
MSIIIIPIQLVKSLLRSKFFWFSIGGFALLLWLTKFDFSKVIKIIKLLGKLGVNLVALFLHLAISPFVKMFQEIDRDVGV